MNYLSNGWRSSLMCKMFINHLYLIPLLSYLLDFRNNYYSGLRFYLILSSHSYDESVYLYLRLLSRFY